MKIPFAPHRVLPSRVRTYPAEEVTTIGTECNPRDVDLTPKDINRVWKAVIRFYKMGLQPSIALCIRHRGQVVMDRTIGHSRGNGPNADPDEPKELARPETLYNLMSGSKCVLAVLVHMLDDEGLLHVDDRVVDYIPEFGRNGKQDITIRHILSHRAGIPAVPRESLDLELLSDHDRVMALLCDAKPVSVAGRSLAYHAITGGYILADIIRRVCGCDVRTLLGKRIREPLGFKHFDYGVSPELLPRVAVESFTGPRPVPFLARQLETSLGLGMRELVDVANDPRFLTNIVPSGNIIGTANEACRFFEMLLRGGTLDGVEVMDPRVIRRATSEQSYMELDRIILLPVRYSLGFMLGADHLSFYGPHTPQAFGHLGFTNVLTWADPARELSVAFLNNGKPFVTPELLVWLNIMRVIAKTFPTTSKG